VKWLEETPELASLIWFPKKAASKW